MPQWPEIHKYCGCFSLRCGTVIKILFDLIFTSIGIIYNGYVFALLIKLTNTISDIVNEAKISGNHTEIEIKTFIVLYKALLIYHISWIAFKIVFLFFVALGIYSIWKKKPSLLKIYLYATIVNFAVDIIIGFIKTFIGNTFDKISSFASVCIQGYHILLLSTLHKKMTGNSKLVSDETERVRNEAMNLPSRGFISPPHRNNFSFSSATTPGLQHCSSCTCPLFMQSDIPSPTTSVASTVSTIVISTISESSEAKEPNLKDDPVIFNQELLTPGTSSIIEDSIPGTSGLSHVGIIPLRTDRVNNVGVESTHERERDLPGNGIRAIRPTTLALSTNNKDDKNEEDIAPVIYDHTQLNLGFSQIFENGHI